MRTILPPLNDGCVGSTPESITATDTPAPVSPRLLRASRPRVAVCEVEPRNLIDRWASTRVTPVLARAEEIWAEVPRAATTPILAKLVIFCRPAVSTACSAAAMSAPWT